MNSISGSSKAQHQLSKIKAAAGYICQAMLFSPSFLGGFLIISVGHMVLSTIVQSFYYARRASQPELWKVQPKKAQSLHDVETRRKWWLPLLSLLRVGREKAGRHPLHGLFATINIVIASTAAGTVSHLIAAGKTRLYWDEGQGSAWRLVLGLALAMAWQCLLEYYWHRLMHLPAVYSRLHKYHHFYKSPEPFDDLFIHPLEATGYYLQLYSPPFIFAIPVSSFGAYMIICGICGVLDHCGVALSMPGLYNTIDHDRHHSRFEVNYSFPFPFFDILHGTYDGTFLGKHYSCTKASRLR